MNNDQRAEIAQADTRDLIDMIGWRCDVDINYLTVCLMNALARIADLEDELAEVEDTAKRAAGLAVHAHVSAYHTE